MNCCQELAKGTNLECLVVREYDCDDCWLSAAILHKSTAIYSNRLDHKFAVWI